MKLINKVLLKKEYKQRFKFFLIWGIALSAMCVMFMALFPIMKNMVDLMIESMGGMANMPGVGDLEQLKHVVGYFSLEVGTMYSMVGLIFAGIVGATLLSGEEKMGTSEYLYSMPISRREIWFTKLFFGAMAIIAVNLMFMVVSFFSLLLFGIPSVLPAADIGAFCVYILFNIIMQLTALFVLYSLASLMGKSCSMAVGLMFGLGFYIVNMIYALAVSAIEPGLIKDVVGIFKYIIPFTFSDAATIFGALGANVTVTIKTFWLNFIGLPIWVVGSGIMLVISYRKFLKRDLA